MIPYYGGPPGFPVDDGEPWERLKLALRECMGMDATGHPLAPLRRIGQSNSGPVVTVTSGNPQKVLQIQQEQLANQGCNGLASVFVSVSDSGPVSVDADAKNEVLRLRVAYQSGTAGGVRIIDATKGAVFAIPGDNVVDITAYLESSIAGEPLDPSSSKSVQASVDWGTSISPQGELFAASLVNVNSDIDSVWIPIPNGAKSMIALVDTPSTLALLMAEFATRPDDVDIKYRVQDPFSNGCPIVLGVNYVRFTLTEGTTNVSPVFQYYI